MRWLKPHLRNSINAILSFGHSRPPPPPEAEPDYSIDDIRDSMLALAEDDEDNAQVKRRIRYAIDVQTLWYLRGDLMAVLAGRYGEVAARAKLSSINDMFENLLPQGLRSRPSPLSAATKDD